MNAVVVLAELKRTISFRFSAGLADRLGFFLDNRSVERYEVDSRLNSIWRRFCAITGI